MPARKRLKRKWPLVALTFALIVLLAGGFALGRELWKMGLFGEPGEPGEDEVVQLDSFNVLLLGVDEREGETRTRTDTIILMNVDSKNNRVSMLSIPRDTWVDIPGRGMDKINAANVYGGPELAARTVSGLVGLPVRNYVVADFGGFEGVVDALGGVTIDVEKDMRYNDLVDPELSINLKKGEQLLDGHKALQYVRYRSDAMGDISRTERQLSFLTALGKEAMQPSTVTKLHKLAPSVYKCVDTNLSLNQMAKLALAARNLESISIVTQTLPGRFLDAEYGSYWQVEPSQARQVARAFFEKGQRFDVVQDSTISARPQSQLTASGTGGAGSGSDRSVIPPAAADPVPEAGEQGGEVVDPNGISVIVIPAEPPAAPSEGGGMIPIPPAPPAGGDDGAT